MGNSDSEFFLRPEASPVPYETLHKRAKKILDSMIQALQAAAKSAAKERPTGDEIAIDMNRLSRIFFVSGEPGSGKTTLYLTLKAMLSSKSEFRKYRKGYREENRLGGLEESTVRWLDPIDLEVASDEGENLLAAVLVRLVRKLDESTSGFSKPCGDAIKKLEELTADIGMAWDSNLQARAGALDPDMFSMEVMRAQRARLRVNERLREALDELATNNCCGCKSNTLFVLPIDDLYLNPNVSLQLLRLLRMISVPRLFFLVMGDITTVEAIFLEKALADWTAMAGAEVFRARPERLNEALARARELRARFLRKLLPPGQRAVIEVMEWDDALKFKPETRDGKEGKVATLKCLLKKADLDSPPNLAANNRSKSQTTLLNHLIWPPCSDENERASETSKEGDLSKEEQEKQKKRKKEAREAYTSLQILDATPREIMDLWTELNKLSPSGLPEDSDQPTVYAPLLLLVVECVKLAIEEQNFLNEQEQDSLRVVLPTRHYSPRDIQFDMARLILRPVGDPWTDVLTGEYKELLWVRTHRSWKLMVNGLRRDKGTEPFANLLPPRATAWLVLLHDLAWKWNQDSLRENLVKRLRKRFEDSPPVSKAVLQSNKENVWKERFLKSFDRFVSLSKKDDGHDSKQGPDPETKQEGVTPKLDLPNDLRGWAVWRNGSTYEHFPMPELETFRDLDRFLFVWSSGLDWLEEQRKLAAQAREQADEAKAQAKAVRGQKKTGAVEAQKIAEAVAVQKENEVLDKQRQADEAQNRVGVDESQQISKFIYLWGIAGTTVSDESYERFAMRDKDWFEKQLEDFRKDIEENHPDKGWRGEICTFKKRVLNH